MIKIGQKILDFEMDAFHNEEIKKVKLSDYRGKWLVLMFYPADFTFVCPTELEELAGCYERFEEIGAEILCVSTDTAFVHKAWHDHSPAVRKVRFPMLADTGGKLSREFGSYVEEDGHSLRATFIVDPDGILKAMEMNDNSFGRSAKELLRKLQAAIFVREHGGQVCPAGWEPGKSTLRPGVDMVGKI